MYVAGESARNRNLPFVSELDFIDAFVISRLSKVIAHYINARASGAFEHEYKHIALFEYHCGTFVLFTNWLIRKTK